MSELSDKIIKGAGTIVSSGMKFMCGSMTLLEIVDSVWRRRTPNMNVIAGYAVLYGAMDLTYRRSTQSNNQLSRKEISQIVKKGIRSYEDEKEVLKTEKDSRNYGVGDSLN